MSSGSFAYATVEQHGNKWQMEASIFKGWGNEMWFDVDTEWPTIELAMRALEDVVWGGVLWQWDSENEIMTADWKDQ